MVLALSSKIPLCGQLTFLFRDNYVALFPNHKGQCKPCQWYGPTLGPSPDVKVSFSEALAVTVRLVDIMNCISF